MNYFDNKAGSLIEAAKQVKEKTIEVEGNAFTKALVAARDNGDKVFSVNGKQYRTEDLDKLDVDKVKDVINALKGATKAHKGQADSLQKALNDDASNDKSDDGDGMDKVDPKAVKKKFKDRKDKDLDNDGDTDDSDEYLHKKRQAISKAVNKEEVDLDEGKIVFDDHDADDKDFVKLIKKHGLKAKSDGDDTTVTGNPDKIEKVLQTMYGNDWKDMYTRKGQNFENFAGKGVDLDEDTVILDLEDDDKKLMSDIKRMGIKVKKVSNESGDGYAEYSLTGSKSNLEKANKKLKLVDDDIMAFKEYVEANGTKKRVAEGDKRLKANKEQKEENLLDIQQKKNYSMREAMAKIWGVEEGYSYFAKDTSIDEGKMKQLHQMIDAGKSAKDIAKAMKVDVKTIEKLMPKKESTVSGKKETRVIINPKV